MKIFNGVFIWLVLDILSIFTSLLLSWIFCNGYARIGDLPHVIAHLNWWGVASWVLVKLCMYFFGRLPRTLWQYAGYGDFIKGVLVIAVTGALSSSILYFTGNHFQLSTMTLIVLFDIVLLMSTRVLCRWFVAIPPTHRFKIMAILSVLPFVDQHKIIRCYHKLQVALGGEYPKDCTSGKIKRALIIGAGVAGKAIIEELTRNPELCCEPIVAIDDDASKLGSYFCSLKIIGGRECIVDAVKKYHIDTIIIAMPKVGNHVISEICTICSTTGCDLKILPFISDSLQKAGRLYSQVRSVKIEDLLGRAVITLQDPNITKLLRDKVVLITGAGGSIGSELVRTIAQVGNCKQLVLVDIYENNLYDIQQELIIHYPKVEFVALISSIRDPFSLDKVFSLYRPQVVFHAAAHKHVPLMETMPAEAIKNNVYGTLNLVEVSRKYEVERFIQISTDKAVRPTNVMGASKRLCEMIIQSANDLPAYYPEGHKTQFLAVRFGNVLGSNGSVIPLFTKQIENGGFVTITDKRITRYFMTIPEAVSLVLLAGGLAKGGEIFILDMGKEVKIVDLAHNLIRLAGLIPDVDIEVKEIGLRPGEKLYEELLMDDEGKISTQYPKIFIGTPLADINWEIVQKKLKVLEAVLGETPEVIRKTLSEILPTYRPEDFDLNQKESA